MKSNCFTESKTYLKTYETIEETTPKFKINDVVYCIDIDNTSSEDLKLNTKYIITDVTNNFNGTSWLYKIKPANRMKPNVLKNIQFLDTVFFEDRFITDIEYYALKYNIL